MSPGGSQCHHLPPPQVLESQFLNPGALIPVFSASSNQGQDQEGAFGGRVGVMSPDFQGLWFRAPADCIWAPAGSSAWSQVAQCRMPRTVDVRPGFPTSLHHGKERPPEPPPREGTGSQAAKWGAARSHPALPDPGTAEELLHLGRPWVRE